MKILKQRTGPAANLAFLGLMCAVDAVMATLSTLVPLSALFVIIFLPLVSALTVIVCEDKYILVYLVAAIALSLGVTAYSIVETLFYIIPATMVGTLYGFLMKKGFPSAYLIFLCALLETGLNYAALPLIKLLSGQDFLLFMETLLGVAENPLTPYLIPGLIFLYSMMEVLLTHFVSLPLLKQFGIETKSLESFSWLYEVIAIAMGILAIGMGFAEISLGYCFLIASVFFLVYSILTYVRKLPAWTYVMLGVVGAAGWVLFACLYRFMPPYSGVLLLGIVTISFAIPCLIVRLLFSVTKEVTKESHE